MAESGLSLGFGDLSSEVGFYLGYGRTSSSWSTAQAAEIDIYVQAGTRRVYYPPAIPGLSQDMLGYEWSWLRPTTTIDIESGTADYDLPDDLGRVVSAFYYPEAEYRQPIQQVSVGKILALRSSTALTGPPTYFATRFKAEDRTAGSRQEVLFYPEPDDDWTLTCEYEAYSGQLSDDYPYPLGGMKMAELFTESCIAVAESRTEDAPGIHAQLFQTLLVDAIQRDKKQGATFYGPMGDTTEEPTAFRRGYDGSTGTVTYNGDEI